MMLGQTKLKNKLSTMIANSAIPRFFILEGPAGGGKELVVRWLAEQMGATFIRCGIKVDEIRDVIGLSYHQVDKIVYFIDRGDSLSAQASNAILKITEEPPNNAYYVLSSEDASNLLKTLRSRGPVISLDRYTPADIAAYFNSKDYNSEYLRIIKEVCDTPGSIDSLVSYNVNEFYNFVEKVLDNLGAVSGVNAFKIATKMKFKADAEEGWDIILFLRMVQLVSEARAKLGRASLYSKLIAVCSKYLDLFRTSQNKQMLFDSWLLEAKGVLDAVV